MSEKEPSPLDQLAERVQQRLQPGEIGVVAARAGVGKTACLVQLGLTELLADRPVLHIALDLPVSDVRGWYDRIIREAGRRNWLDSSDTTRIRLERARLIHSYLQQGFTAERLSEALALMTDVMDFQPHTVVLDGFPFEVASHDAVEELHAVVREHGVRLWLTALTHRHEPPDEATGLPRAVAPFAANMALVLRLTPEGEHVRLRFLRDHEGALPPDPELELDPATLLVVPA